MEKVQIFLMAMIAFIGGPFIITLSLHTFAMWYIDHLRKKKKLTRRQWELL